MTPFGWFLFICGIRYIRVTHWVTLWVIRSIRVIRVLWV